MGDPWKSITPKGVQAFVNATIATLVVWLTVENHLAIIVNYLSGILSSQTAGLSAYFLVLALYSTSFFIKEVLMMLMKNVQQNMLF
jgi:hypothetical protein